MKKGGMDLRTDRLRGSGRSIELEVWIKQRGKAGPRAVTSVPLPESPQPLRRPSGPHYPIYPRRTTFYVVYTKGDGTRAPLKPIDPNVILAF